MSRTNLVTPWARAALAAAGLSVFELNGRLSGHWYMTGAAVSPRGPWRFALHNFGERHEVVCHFVADIPPAIDWLFEQAGLPSTLETQLRASLELVR